MKICVLFTLGFIFIGDDWQLSNMIYDNPLCSGPARKDERKGVALLHKVGLGSQHCLKEISWYILSLWTYFLFNAVKDSLVLCQTHEIRFLNFTVIYNGKILPWDPVHSWRIHSRNMEVFLFKNYFSVTSIVLSPDLKSSENEGGGFQGHCWSPISCKTKDHGK